jgi:hypothetical protein
MADILQGGVFVQWNDPAGNPIYSINRDGTHTVRGDSRYLFKH